MEKLNENLLSQISELKSCFQCQKFARLGRLFEKDRFRMTEGQLMQMAVGSTLSFGPCMSREEDKVRQTYHNFVFNHLSLRMPQNGGKQ
jgi:hypothetical protein